MIADQQIGTNFMKALGYNLRKMNLPDIARRPELLETNFTSLDLSRIKKEVDLIKQLRPNLSRYVYHTSLNFSKEEDDSLTNETLLSIAHEYLQAMGFTHNQYFIFRHHDADHPHIHLLVNRIRFDGTVVSDSNNYKRSEAILRKLEYQYNLIPVEQSRYKVIEQGNGIAIRRGSYIAARPPKNDELEMVLRTGKPSDKMVLQEKLKQLIKKTCHYTILSTRQSGREFIYCLTRHRQAGSAALLISTKSLRQKARPWVTGSNGWKLLSILIMNKLVIAKQLAKQTAEQLPNTENSDQSTIVQSQEQETELMNFLEAMQKILSLTDGNRALLLKQEQRMDQLAKKHSKEIRWLIMFLLIPVIMAIIGLTVLLILK